MNRVASFTSICLLALVVSACGPGPAPSPDPAHPENTPTALLTSTAETPERLIEADTSCTGGPGGDYQLIATLQAGDRAPVVGKDDYGEYWIVIDRETGRGCLDRPVGHQSPGSVGLPAQSGPRAHASARPAGNAR